MKHLCSIKLIENIHTSLAEGILPIPIPLEIPIPSVGVGGVGGVWIFSITGQ